jgi:prepilin-type N-terminal cleavage/methylation domain-containing protein
MTSTTGRRAKSARGARRVSDLPRPSQNGGATGCLQPVPPAWRTGGQAASGTRRHGTRAFTLLELIVVLGLVGVLLALASPSLKGFMGTRQTADTADEIGALTHLASSRAAAQGTPYRLNFDPQAGQYWLTMQEQGQFVNLGTEFGRRFNVPTGVGITLRRPAGTEARLYIEFQPSGRAEEVTIEIQGQRGEVFRVVCESATEAFHVVAPNEAG